MKRTKYTALIASIAASLCLASGVVVANASTEQVVPPGTITFKSGSSHCGSYNVDYNAQRYAMTVNLADIRVGKFTGKTRGSCTFEVEVNTPKPWTIVTHYLAIASIDMTGTVGTWNYRLTGAQRPINDTLVVREKRDPYETMISRNHEVRVPAGRTKLIMSGDVSIRQKANDETSEAELKAMELTFKE